MFSDIVQGGIQTYLFTLTDSFNNESPPKTITIEGFSPTGIKNVDKDFATLSKIDKILTIKGDVSNIKIYNIMGELTFSLNDNSQKELQISLNNYASGLYIVNLFDKRGNKKSEKITF